MFEHMESWRATHH